MDYILDKYIRDQIDLYCGDKKVIHYTLNHTTLYIFTIYINKVVVTYHLEYFHNCIEEELAEVILTGFINQHLVDNYTGDLNWAFNVISGRLRIENEK